MTAYKFTFDDDKFEATARVVIKFNPHVVGRTVESLVDEMKRMAVSSPLSICGTRGYYVASCHSPDSDDALYVSAFPAPWLIPTD